MYKFAQNKKLNRNEILSIVFIIIVSIISTFFVSGDYSGIDMLFKLMVAEITFTILFIIYLFIFGLKKTPTKIILIIIIILNSFCFYWFHLFIQALKGTLPS